MSRLYLEGKSTDSTRTASFDESENVNDSNPPQKQAVIEDEHIDVPFPSNANTLKNGGSVASVESFDKTNVTVLNPSQPNRTGSSREASILSVDSNAFDDSAPRNGGPQVERDDVNEFLQDFGAFTGSDDDLTLDEQGLVSLTVDGEIEVMLAHLPHFPGIVALVEFNEELLKDPAVLRRALKANISWEQTHGGCFAVLPPTKQLMLCRLIGLVDRDLERIDDELGAFVNLARIWQESFELDSLFGDETGSERDSKLVAPQFQSGMIRA